MPTARQLSLRLVVTIFLLALAVLIILLPHLIKRQKVPALLLTAATTFVDSAIVPAGDHRPDSAAVMSALARVLDPEIGISIVDLGLVHSLRVDSTGNVNVAIALTTPECPYGRRFGSQAVKEALTVAGVHRVEILLNPSIPWDPTRLSPEARARYRSMFGDSRPVTPPSSLLAPP